MSRLSLKKILFVGAAFGLLISSHNTYADETPTLDEVVNDEAILVDADELVTEDEVLVTDDEAEELNEIIADLEVIEEDDLLAHADEEEENFKKFV